MSEHARIARLRARSRSGADVGIGDDAAVLAKDERPQVLSCDVSVEGVHFRAEFADWRTLGRRAAVAALSDLAAMGAEPRAMLSSLILPRDFSEPDFDALVEGIAAAGDEVGAPVVGGNLARGEMVLIDTTVVGALETAPLLRSGARVGDGIYVAGFPGAAALGLHALLHAQPDAAPSFVDTWRTPRVDFDLARRVRAYATAAIDLSDGLVQDLTHLCEDSAVGASIDVAAIPRMDGFEQRTAELGADLRALLLHGGEAYTLLFTAPDSPDAVRIGTIEEVLGVRDADGRELLASGFDHFAEE